MARMSTVLTKVCSIGSSANFMTTMLKGDGVPNDVIGNFNSLSIICLGPVLNVSIWTSWHGVFVSFTCATC